MLRAIRLAMRGRGSVEPNPMVGCVIVRDGERIGEGYHRRFGGPHAEREALAACTRSPAGASAYVTLEPCCHTNKKTPPCVPALIEAGIERVVVACTDPNPAVCGQGLAQLQSAGIAFETGLLENQAKQLNAPFFARMLHRRPYVTLKWAQSADGRVAGSGGKRMQISNAASMRLVHRLRARCDAILVGIRTAIWDDPLLTTRNVEPARPLLRVVLDTHLRLPTSSQLVQTARQWPLLVYCTSQEQTIERRRALELAGAQVIFLPADESGHPSLPEMLTDLHARQVTHLLVEGGPTVASSFLRQNLSDRVWVFHSPVVVNSPTAPAAPTIDYPTTGQIDVESDRLVEMLNPESPVFYDLTPSADLPACPPDQ